jgi:hypothetical protein
MKTILTILTSKWFIGSMLLTASGVCSAEPVSAFIIANAATFQMIGTAMSVIGALQQGQQAKQSAEYNAAIARNNAIASQQQSAANAAAQQRKARMQMGTMRAGYGASGIGLEGSPMDILEQSAAMAELDRQNILYGGTLRTQGFTNTANLEEAAGENAESASYLKAGSSLLLGMGKSGMTTGVKEDTLFFDDWNTGSNMRRTG